MIPRIALVAVGILIVLGIARAVLPQSRESEDVAVDTTGATAGQARATAAALGTPPPGAAAAGTATAIAAAATPGPPTATPMTVQGTVVSQTRKPLILLNPGTVRQGSSVGITGSGFDAGATIDLLFKRKEADKGDAITFVQLDKSGAFGSVSFTVPETMATGSFIIEARQRQSDKVAFAVGIVAGGAPKVKLGIQVGKPGDLVELS